MRNISLIQVIVGSSDMFGARWSHRCCEFGSNALLPNLNAGLGLEKEGRKDERKEVLIENCRLLHKRGMLGGAQIDGCNSEVRETSPLVTMAFHGFITQYTPFQTDLHVHT